MKNKTVLCGEHPIRLLFNDDQTLAWINLQDLCKALGREEIMITKEALRICPSAILIPFRKNSTQAMFAISPYDVYKLMRPMRKENPVIAKHCAKVEEWLNELLEKSAVQTQQQEQHDIVFEYQDHPISFRAANGRVMINATQMAKGFSILPSDILRKAEFLRYRQHLVNIGVSESLDSQILTIRGRNTGATWIDEALAIEFARHLSPDFSQWCNSKINQLLNGSANIETHTDTATIPAEKLSIPQNLDEARKLIISQHQEIQIRQKQLEANHYKIEFYDNLIEGRDFYTTTWLAQELNTTPRMIHQFLAEKGICKFEKNQWVTFNAYKQWQIDIPYYWNDLRKGKCRPAGTRKRWSKLGREQIIELYNQEPPKFPERPLPGQRHRKENPYKNLVEGVDYFKSTQIAQKLGISASRLNKHLEENGICHFKNKEWTVLAPYEEWQISVPYYWTNPKTEKCWAYGSRKRWTKTALEKIIKLWNQQNKAQEEQNKNE